MLPRTLRILMLTVLLCPAALHVSASLMVAQSETEAMAMSRLLRDVAEETAAHAGARAVFLDIHPANAPVMVWQVFTEELHDKGAEVRTGEEHGVPRLSVDIRGMHSSAVSIDNSSYLKTISLSAGILLEDPDGKRMEWSKEFTLSRSDTLRGTTLPEERDFLAGSDESWFETLLTPLTVTATAIILVTLLFTVRGS